MLRFHGKYPLQVFFVKSRSKEGKVYKVELWGDGKLTCECPGGTYRKTCPHIREKIAGFKAVFGGLEEALEHYRNLKKQENEEKKDKIYSS